jgi:hypothetical protein
VSGHSLKLHFCMSEKSHVKHNNLDCHNFLGIFFSNCKVYMLIASYKLKMFSHVQSIQTLKMHSPYFFSNILFSTKCAPFLLKFRNDFNIDN